MCYTPDISFFRSVKTMSIDKVREYFKTFGIDDQILEFDVSSATVELSGFFWPPASIATAAAINKILLFFIICKYPFPSFS